jgi:hypothetical protein
MKRFIYPIHIAPVKPLNPNHVRHLIYTDLMYKLNSFVFGNTTYLYNFKDMELTTKVITLHYFLKTKYGSKIKNFKDKDDLWVGLNYMEMTKDDFKVSDKQIVSMRKKIYKNTGTINFSQNVIRTWISQHTELGLMDPGFNKTNNKDMSPAATLKKLSKKGVVLNTSKLGGPIYFDLTDKGQFLKTLSGSNILTYNYIFKIIMTIFGNCKKEDLIVFVFDDEQYGDFILIKHILNEFGYKVFFSVTSRIGLEGKINSSRFGGWEKYTLSIILERYKKDYSPEAVRLGLKLYFMLCFAGKSSANFSYLMLDKYVRRAEGFLKKYKNLYSANLDNNEFKQLLKNITLKSDTEYLSPFRLSESLFSSKINENVKLAIIKNFFI